MGSIDDVDGRSRKAANPSLRVLVTISLLAGSGCGARVVTSTDSLKDSAPVDGAVDTTIARDTATPSDGTIDAALDSSLPPGWSRHDFADGNDRYTVFARTPIDVWTIASNADQLSRWDGSTWHDVPLGTSAPAETIWAASATDIFTGGIDTAKRRGDGHSWTGWGGPEEISGIWGTSSTDVWAVGLESLSGGPSPNVIMHYDGTSWARSKEWPQPSIIVKDWRYDFTVHGTGPDNVWAFKHAAEGTGVLIGPPEMFRWDGTVWTSKGYLRYDGLGAGGANSGRLWVLSPEDVWVVYAGELYHYDGASFEHVDVPGTFSAVWASNAHDVWAVGTAGLIARYDGASWSVTTPLVSAHLFAIHGKSADDVWIVGARGVALHFGTTRH